MEWNCGTRAERGFLASELVFPFKGLRVRIVLCGDGELELLDGRSNSVSASGIL
jgi:hypothetical protein